MKSEQYKILYPVDFYTRSRLAAPYVKTWVDRLGAALDTLHVVDDRELSAEREDELRYLTEKRMGDLKHFSDLHFGKKFACCTVLSGGIADRIEYFAKERHVDLIMLPRDHQNLPTRFIRDSLTASVLDRCTALVWTTEYLEEVSPVPSSILCAVHLGQDVSLDAQDRILQSVRDLVFRFQARVAFLCVRKDDQESSGGSTDLEGIAEIESWQMKARDIFGSSVAFLRRPGDVITTIRDTAKELAADLIVVGRTRPGAIGLGRQTHILKIDHAAHRPVLSVW
jgi:nucleotide-binding universal stress UspA family protein